MLADTSHLIALFHPNDKHHAEAVRLHRQQAHVAVQQTVLAETLQHIYHVARATMTTAKARAREREALDAILDILKLRITPVEDLQLARRLHRAHPQLSFVDACGIADARPHGGILTFDNEQKRLAKAL